MSSQATLKGFENDSDEFIETVPKFKDYSWLRRQHWEFYRPVQAMADDAGVSENTLTEWMDRLGVGYRIYRTEQECLDAVKRVLKEHGEGTTIREYEAVRFDDEPNETTVRKLLGDWNDVMLDLGYTPNQRDWSEKECEDALLRVAERVGRSPTWNEYRQYSRDDEPSYESIETRLGEDQSWNSSKEAVGLRVYQKRWTDEECIEALKRITEELGKSPSAPEYEKHQRDNEPTRHAMQNYFGSWNEAKRMAGLSVFTHEGNGVSYPYGSRWMRQRATVVERDQYECQKCGVDDDTYREQVGIGLDVHHIHKLRLFYHDLSDEEIEQVQHDNRIPSVLKRKIKTCSMRANHESNLITVCRTCHRELEYMDVSEQVKTLGVKSPLVSPGDSVVDFVNGVIGQASLDPWVNKTNSITI